MSRYKNEASNFKSALQHSKLIFHGDDRDKTWDIVMSSLIQEDSKRKDIQYLNRQKFEYPFINSERPDIYFEVEDFILGIEHFRFDSSKQTKKGSTYTRKKLSLDKAVDQEYKLSSESHYYSTKTMDIPLCYNNYIDSLLNAYNKHKRNIETYKKNLQQIAPNKKILFAFYIEDITPHGNYIVSKEGREELNITRIKDFVNALSKTEGIDYILTRTQFDCIYTFHIQQLSNFYIKELLEKCYSPNKYIFLDYSPEFIYSISPLE